MLSDNVLDYIYKYIREVLRMIDNPSDRMNKLTPEQLDQVTGGQWTPADWIEGTYTVIEDAPDVQCGECFTTGTCQKVDYVIIQNGVDVGGIFYRCGTCGASVGIGRRPES